MENNFAQLDAQSAESHFAQFTPEEHAEYQAYLDARAHKADLVADDQPDAEPHVNDVPSEDNCPKCLCNPCKCNWQPGDEESSHGTPGDGSGEDDLADLMAHGDEGCCDSPGE